MMFKKTLKSLLRRFGLRITKEGLYPQVVMPFDFLPYLIESKLRDKPDFYFVQVGANNGVIADKLNPIIKKYGLRGVLVEPLPDLFEELKGTYKEQSGLSFVNCAIGMENKEVDIYRFRRDAPVPDDFYHGLARLDGKYIQERAGREGLLDHVEKVKVEMVTFERFAERLGLSSFDLLYVDTEGHDINVISSAFKAGFYPEIINYEWSEMPEGLRYDLKIMLLDNGYRFVDVGSDTVCIRVVDAA